MRRTLLAALFVLLSRPVVAQDVPCHLVSTSSGGYTLECPPPFAEPHEKLFHGLMVAAGAVQFGEKMETMYVIGRGNGRELNPILAPYADNPVAFGVITGAVITASTIIIAKLHASPNRTMRWIARILVAEQLVLGTWALVNNAQYTGRR